MTQHPDAERAPEVDYRHTSTRPAFAELPAQVRRAVADLAGGTVLFAHPPVRSGFTAAYAGRLELADGRRVFAKAADPSAPHARRGIELESAVLARLGGRATAPRLVGAGSVGDWRLVVMEAIDGRMPGMPWTPDAAEAVHRACLAVAEVPPADAAGLTASTLAQDVGRDPVALATLDSFADSPAACPSWLPPLGPAAAADLARLGRRAASALGGDQIVHGDLRPDNLLVDRSGAARMVDWNWVSWGPGWADFVGLWPVMAMHGLDVGQWQSRSPLLAGTEPERVDAFLAALAGLMAGGASGDASSPSLALLRAHQRLMAVAFVSLLKTRRGWA